jgi:hypothetical protein
MTTMTDEPTGSSRPCTATGCAGTCVDPAHAVNVAPAGGLPVRAPLCPPHWQHVDGGGEWFAEERAGDLRTRGIQVVTGDDLARRRLVVPEGPGLTWHRGGFSPQLDPGRNFGVLRVEGRVQGSDERVHVDLALTPGALAQLRAVLKLYTDAGDPH